MKKVELKYKPSLEEAFVKPMTLIFEDVQRTILVEAKKYDIFSISKYLITLRKDGSVVFFYGLFEYEDALFHLNAMISFMAKNAKEILVKSDDELLNNYKEFFKKLMGEEFRFTDEYLTLERRRYGY